MLIKQGSVGWDRTGGYSYSKYQFASNPGAMDDFISSLKKTNPEMAAKLEAVGGAGAARSGSKEFQKAFSSITNGGN